MRILGIDPGFDRLGVAVLEHGGKNGSFLHSGCVETDRTAEFKDRIIQIGDEVSALLVKYAPEVLAIERLYFNKNQKTAMRVAEVRGIMVYLAERHRCRVVEYTPQQVKVAVTGYGKSDKKQVADMVRRLLPEVQEGLLDDEYDAIAIALTALVSVR